MPADMPTIDPNIDPADQLASDAKRAAAALDRLAELHPKLIDLGLQRTIDLLARLDDPHHRLPPVIHVAGTNGKGSVIAMMRAMAEAAGLTVHVYASPHLCRFNERIRLAGKLIDDAALADLLEEVEAANGNQPVTFFEVTTAAALLAFSRVPADLLLLETGLGGALDSTNILDKPAATAITPIARDHEHFLGSDLAGIATQKAGIMREGVPCLSAAQHADAMVALDQHAVLTGTGLKVAGRDFAWHAVPDGGISLVVDGWQARLAPPALHGVHQQANAALAAATLHAALPGLDFQAAGAGTAQASWPGRLQRLDSGSLTALLGHDRLWLDGAHNAHGAAALAAALKGLDPVSAGPASAGPASADGSGWHFICGALNTRPAEEFLAAIAPHAASIQCVTIPNQPASLSAEALAGTARRLLPTARAAGSVAEALSNLAARDCDSQSPVMICGSLYLAGHVLAANGTLPH